MKSHHQAIIDIADGVDRFMRSAFTSITVEGPELDAVEFQKHPHMIVSTHRSHVDYYMAGYMLIFRGFKHLRFAAGSNLTKLPYIGPRFRAFGAFTVEREIAFERNYVKNLCNSVVTMMENREAVIVFPEGGRSYSNSILEVKSGILGAAVLMQARLDARLHARSPDQEVLLLPMAISYECPPDAKWFGLLLAGKRLRKHMQPFFKRLLGNVLYFGADILAFAPFMMAPKTGRKYGAVFIDYGAPLSMRAIVDIDANRAAGARDPFFEHRASMQKVAEVMRHQFFALYRLLPMHVLAYVMRSESAIDAATAAARMPAVLEALAEAGKNKKSLDGRTPAQLVEEGTRQLERLGAITVRGSVLRVRRQRIVQYCSTPVIDDPRS